jgi:hypothetical protein
MRKTFQLTAPGKNRDRTLEAVKHEIRKYIRRERGRDLPAGTDFLDFDCRFGLTQETAEVVHPGNLIGLIDAVAKDGAESFYVELLAKPGHRKARPADAAGAGPDATERSPEDEAH